MMNQSSQMMLMNQLINNNNNNHNMNQLQSQRGYVTWQQNTNSSVYIPYKNRRNTTSFGGNNNNHKHTNNNNNNNKSLTVNELRQQKQQNRLKPKRYSSKKKFNSKSAPFAPRNTTSFLIRAKKSGGITSLVSPCPVTPAVLPTPIFTPSREVLVDMAKEEWGVDGYGSMKGLIRLRTDGNDNGNDNSNSIGNDNGNVDEEGGSSESDVEEHEHEHLEVEKRLDHDLSRFEMVYPNYGGSDNLLENRVDDQDSNIARLEEENLVLKERLFLMEREFKKLRMRLLSLETRAGARGFVEEVVGNESENESGSRGYGNSEVFEENKNNVDDDKDSDNGEKCDVGVDVYMERSIQKIEEKMNVIEDVGVGVGA